MSSSPRLAPVSSADAALAFSRLQQTNKSVTRGAIEDIRDRLPAFQKALCEGGLPILFQVLLREREDASITAELLDLLVDFLTQRGARSHPSIESKIAVDAFLESDKQSRVLAHLLDCLEAGYHGGEGIALLALDILNSLALSRPKRVADALVKQPIGINLLINTISGEDEASRSLAIEVLTHLSSVHTALIAQLLSQDIIRVVTGLIELALSTDDSVDGFFSAATLGICTDCLQLLVNLLANNAAIVKVIEAPGFFHLVAAILAGALHATTLPRRSAQELSACEQHIKTAVVAINMLKLLVCSRHTSLQFPNASLMDMLDVLYTEGVSEPAILTARQQMATTTSILDILTHLAWRDSDSISSTFRCDCLLLVSVVMLTSIEVQRSIGELLICTTLPDSDGICAPITATTPAGLQVMPAMAAALSYAYVGQDAELQNCCLLLVGASLYGRSTASRLTFLAHGHAAPPIPVPVYFMDKQANYAPRLTLRGHDDRRSPALTVAVEAPVSLLWRAILAASNGNVSQPGVAKWITHISCSLLQVALQPGLMRTKHNPKLVVDTAPQEFMLHSTPEKLHLIVNSSHQRQPICTLLATNLLESELAADVAARCSVLRLLYHFIVGMPDAQSRFKQVDVPLQRMRDLCAPSGGLEADASLVYIDALSVASGETTQPNVVAGTYVDKVMVGAGSRYLDEAEDKRVCIIDRNTVKLMVSQTLSKVTADTGDSSAAPAGEELPPSVGALEGVLATVDVDRRVLEDVIASKESDIESLKCKFDDLERRYDSLKNSNEELMASNQALESEKEKLLHNAAMQALLHDESERMKLQNAKLLGEVAELRSAPSAPAEQQLAPLKSILSQREQDLKLMGETIAEQASALQHTKDALRLANAQVSVEQGRLIDLQRQQNQLMEEHTDLLVLLAVKDQHIDMLSGALRQRGLEMEIDRISKIIDQAMEAAATDEVVDAPPERASPGVRRQLFSSALGMPQPHIPSTTQSFPINDAPVDNWAISNDISPRVQPQVPELPLQHALELEAVASHSRTSDIRPRMSSADTGMSSDVICLSPPVVTATSHPATTGPSNQFEDVEITPISHREGFGADSSGIDNWTPEFAHSRLFSESTGLKGFFGAVGPAISNLSKGVTQFRTQILEELASKDQESELSVSDVSARDKPQSTDRPHSHSTSLFGSFISTLKDHVLVQDPYRDQLADGSTEDDNGYISSPDSHLRQQRKGTLLPSTSITDRDTSEETYTMDRHYMEHAPPSNDFPSNDFMTAFPTAETSIETAPLSHPLTITDLHSGHDHFPATMDSGASAVPSGDEVSGPESHFNGVEYSFNPVRDAVVEAAVVEPQIDADSFFSGTKLQPSKDAAPGFASPHTLSSWFS